jgi:hypothetical protein
MSPCATTSGSLNCGKAAGDAGKEVKTNAQITTRLTAWRKMLFEEKNPTRR